MPTGDRIQEGANITKLRRGVKSEGDSSSVPWEGPGFVTVREGLKDRGQGETATEEEGGAGERRRERESKAEGGSRGEGER